MTGHSTGIRTSHRTRTAIPLGGVHDRIIRFAKIALPIAAVVVLLAIIAWPVLLSREFSFILDAKKVAVSAEKLRMEQPLYRGIDQQGRHFAISARRAVQRSVSDATVDLDDLRATIETASGTAVATAPKGAYDLNRERLTVAGRLVIDRVDGYHFETDEAIIDLKSNSAWSLRPSHGASPLGKFEATRFRVNVDTGRAVFDGGVHMRIVQR